MPAPILILGATGGVGQALTRGLAARRIPLFLAARSRDKLAALARETAARHAACDVLDAPSLHRVIEQAAAEGGLAGLAYCVGSIVIKPLRTVREDDFIEAYRLNVVGAALAVKAAQKALEAANGSVVLFSTVAVGQGFPNHAVISAA
jgi:short-subunit dehydrogenase